MIVRLNNMLKEKKISCLELTKKYFSAIEDVDSELNSYVFVEKEKSLKTTFQQKEFKLVVVLKF